MTTRNPYRIVLRIALAAFALAAVSGCTQDDETTPATQALTIRIASPDLSAGPTPSAGGGVAEAMRARQALEKEFAADGITVKWNFFKGAGPAINEGFANGQVDFAYLGDLAAIIGRANGLDTRLIAFTDHAVNEYLATPPDSTIARFGDLRGKRVAVFRGTADQLAFARTLAEHGLSERDVRVINLDWSAARAALIAGQIDAAWGHNSFLALRDKGLVKVPLSTKDGRRSGTLQSGVVVSGTFASAHPELVQRVVNVLAQSSAWAANETNREAFITLLSENNAIPAAVYAAEYANTDLHVRFSPLADAASITRLQASIDAALGAGLIRKGFSATEWVDAGYARNALSAAPGTAPAEPAHDHDSHANGHTAH